jgi:hypothetical protein
MADFTLNSPNRSRDIKLLFLIVIAALLVRRFDAFTRPQLYAEDYTIYFFQFEQYGFSSLLTPYGGYLHFVPRLISIFWGTMHANYLKIPICYSFSEFIVTFLVVFNIWKTSFYLNIKHNILYATCFLFLPIASDIFMNLANINWIVSLYLLNFLFIGRPIQKNKYLTYILILIISLSGPFSTLLSPLILLIIVLERKELSVEKLVPLCLILLGGTIQFIYLKFIDTDFYRGVSLPPDSHHLLKLITNNTGDLLLFRYVATQWSSSLPVMIVSFSAFLLLLSIFIFRYIKVENKRRYILLGYSVIVFCAFIKAYWPNESQVLALYNSRYYFLPFTCIAWLMILSFDTKIKPLYVVLYLIYFVAQLPVISMILPDKQWSKQILEYYDGKRKEISINPEGWHYVLPDRKK